MASTKYKWVAEIFRSFSFAVVLVIALPCSSSSATQQETAADADRLAKEALTLHQQGKFAEALPIAERAVEIRRRVLGEDHPDYATSLNNLGVLYDAMRQYDRAELKYTQALEIRRRVLGENHPDYATSLYCLGALYSIMAQYDKAEQKYTQALEIRRRVLGENHPDYARSLNDLGVVYDAMGEYEKAEEKYTQALEIRKRVLGENHPDYAQSLHNLGVLYFHMGQYEKAEGKYTQALEIFKRVLGENHPDYARNLSNLGVLYDDMGQYDKAELKYTQALEIWRKVLGENHPDYAISLNNLGAVYDENGQYEKAEQKYMQALEIQRRVLGENHPDYATSLRNLGGLYRHMGEYEKAEEKYTQALEIRRKALGENHPDYAQNLSNLGVLYDDMGQYDKAELKYTQALEIRRKVLGENHPDYARSLNRLGLLYFHMGQFEKAEQKYTQALEITKRVLGENLDYAQTLNNLGLLYRNMGQYDKAELKCTQALEIQRRVLGENHPDYANFLLNLAMLWQAMGRQAQALETYDHATRIQQHNLEQVFGFTSEAGMRSYLEMIHFNLDVLVSMAATSGQLNTTESAFRWTLRRKGIISDTLGRFRQMQSLSERDPGVAVKVAQARGLEQQLHSLALNPAKGMSLAAQEKERTALQAEKDRLQGDLNRELAERHPEWAVDKNLDVAAVRRRLPKGSVLVEFVHDYPYNFNAIGKAPRWKPAHYFAFVLPADPNSTVRLIDLGEAEEIDRLISDVRTNVENLAKWLEAKKDASPRDILAEEKTEERPYREAAEKLYGTLFRRSGLREAMGIARTIYISPDGELNRVAFEALVEPQQPGAPGYGRPKYLAEEYRFVYLPAGRDLLRSYGKVGHGTVVFAGPDYNLGISEREAEAQVLLAKSENLPAPVLRGAILRDIRGSRWRPLEGAAEEERDVKKELAGTKYGPVQTYEGKEALEEVFLAVHSPRVLHVATHGYFLPNQKLDPEDRESLMYVDASAESGAALGLGRLRGTEDPLLRSGLVFAGANLVGSPESETPKAGDGWVTAEEVAQMNLQGTELVVLSACETGLGDVRVGDGVQGLQRAFLLAGARSLVMSLYSVPDAESRELMRDFYGGLKAGKSKAAALHEAELNMIRARRKKNGAAHPFFWASFVLVGEAN